MQAYFFKQDCQEKMFSGNILILQLAGFLVRQVDDPLDPRCDENLPCAATKDAGFGARLENVIEPISQYGRIDFENFQDLGDDTLGLLDERQKDMLSIDLIMSVTLDDLGGSLSCLLGTFCESIKSHHGLYTLSKNYNILNIS